MTLNDLEHAFMVSMTAPVSVGGCFEDIDSTSLGLYLIVTTLPSFLAAGGTQLFYFIHLFQQISWRQFHAEFSRMRRLTGAWLYRVNSTRYGQIGLMLLNS